MTDYSILRAIPTISLAETASLLNVSVRQVRNLVKAGKLDRRGGAGRVTSQSIARYLGFSADPVLLSTVAVPWLSLTQEKVGN